MKCNKCNKSDTRVLESREAEDASAIRRRRECQNDKCNNRFTTYERIERAPLTIVKKDATRQLYDREKMVASLRLPTQKTTVTAMQVEEMASSVEDSIYSLNTEEVTSKQIGEFIMKELARANQVAYVRYASVYRNFKDIDEFEDELKIIKNLEVD